MNANTPDDGSQISGRMLAIEILLRQIVERQPDVREFLDETDARLDRTEAALLLAQPDDASFIVNMMEGSRMTVDEFRFQLLRDRRQTQTGDQP